jgi:CRP-like cAMP-binding protein
MDSTVLKGDSGIAERILVAAALFKGWPSGALQQLMAVARLRRLHKGQLLHPENPRVRELVFIGSGYMDVSNASVQGRSFLLGIFGPGHTLGILRMLPGQPAAYEYKARENAVVVCLACNALQALLDAHPELWASVAKTVLLQYKEAMRSVIIRRVGTMSARLAMTLDFLVELHGVQDARGTRLRVRVSQEDLASMLASTRQTINKELQLLAEDGVLDIDYSALLIRDLAALRQRFDFTG